MSSLSPTQQRQANGSSSMRRSSHRKSIAGLVAQPNQNGSLHALIREAAERGDPDPAQLAALNELDVPTSATAAYLASLTTQSLESLQSQPELLASSSASLQEQLSSLCLRQVGPLVQVHQATSHVPAALDNIKDNIDSLIQNTLPKLSQTASLFSSQAEEPLAARSRSRKLLEAHTVTLPDLLDVPDLIRTCVRNGYYDQATKLGAHIANLARSDSHLGGGLVLTSLREECWSELHRMVEEILHLLRGKFLQPPAAGRLIASLRHWRDVDEASSRQPSTSKTRLSNLSDDQLCLTFIGARAAAVSQLLASPLESQRLQRHHYGITSETSSPDLTSSQLSAYIEVWRRSVTETCNVACSLFQRTQILSKALSIFALRHVDMLSKEVHDGVSKLVDHARRVGNPRSTVREAATATEELASSLLSLHTQLSLASQSLSECGANLSVVFHDVGWKTRPPAINGLRVDALQEGSLQILAIPLDRAIQIFAEKMPSPTAHLPSSWLCLKEREESLLQRQDDPSVTPHGIELLECFPALAQLCNDSIIGINSLRSFAPVAMSTKALAILDSHLLQAIMQMTHYCTRLPGPELLASASEAKEDLRLQSNSGVGSAHSAPVETRWRAEMLLAAKSALALIDTMVPYLRRSLWEDVMNASPDVPPLVQSGNMQELRQWADRAVEEWHQSQIPQADVDGSNPPIAERQGPQSEAAKPEEGMPAARPDTQLEAKSADKEGTQQASSSDEAQPLSDSEHPEGLPLQESPQARVAAPEAPAVELRQGQTVVEHLDGADAERDVQGEAMDLQSKLALAEHEGNTVSTEVIAESGFDKRDGSKSANLGDEAAQAGTADNTAEEQPPKQAPSESGEGSSVSVRDAQQTPGGEAQQPAETAEKVKESTEAPSRKLTLAETLRLRREGRERQRQVESPGASDDVPPSVAPVGGPIKGHTSQAIPNPEEQNTTTAEEQGSGVYEESDKQSRDRNESCETPVSGHSTPSLAVDEAGDEGDEDRVVGEGEERGGQEDQKGSTPSAGGAKKKGKKKKGKGAKK